MHVELLEQFAHNLAVLLVELFLCLHRHMAGGLPGGSELLQLLDGLLAWCFTLRGVELKQTGNYLFLGLEVGLLGVAYVG